MSAYSDEVKGTCGVVVSIGHNGEPILIYGLLRKEDYSRQLRDAIDRFVQVYNQQAAPFEWKKAVVHPSGLKPIYSDLRK